VSAPAPASTRLLVVLPTWVGDVVMATPALRALRDRLPGTFVGALARPGVDQILAGSDLLDEIHVDRRAGAMGPKKAAAKLRARRYGAAILLANSFSAAMAVRMAFIPRRIGYERDARGMLLTDRLTPLRRRDTPPFSRSATNPRAWAPIPACDYYMRLVRAYLEDDAIPMPPLELRTTEDEEAQADAVLTSAGLHPAEPNAVILNPGGNNPAKRWPAERFGRLAAMLSAERGFDILVNGAPAERGIVEQVIEAARAAHGEGTYIALPDHGMTLAALKPVVRRAALMVTNDTGPRHIAASFGVPVVTLFGPTDHRWTTIPFDDEIEIVADPTLPEEEVANDHPERCAVERIAFDRVAEAATTLLERAAARAGR